MRIARKVPLTAKHNQHLSNPEQPSHHQQMKQTSLNLKMMTNINSQRGEKATHSSIGQDYSNRKRGLVKP